MMETIRCDEEGLVRAAAVLNAGGVAVIPTDTVYGLAAHPAFPDAVDRLYTIKGREAKKPIALLAADLESIEAFGYPLPKSAAELATRYWPGALTLVIENPTTTQTEGFRIPNHDWTRHLLKMCGGVLRVTSANLSGQRPATDAPQALADVGLAADLVVDDGVSPGGTASTVIRVAASGGLSILRPGPITLDAS